MSVHTISSCTFKLSSVFFKNIGSPQLVNLYTQPQDSLCRLFRNQEELEKLSELGVLFLLFEMGLELSLDRLKVCFSHPMVPCLCTLHFPSHQKPHPCISSNMRIRLSQHLYMLSFWHSWQEVKNMPSCAGTGQVCLWSRHCDDGAVHPCLHRDVLAARPRLGNADSCEGKALVPILMNFSPTIPKCTRPSVPNAY